MEAVPEAILREVYPRRDDWARKGDFGHVLVIGGSGLYSGAPALTALAALRSGCDLVTVASPQRPADIIASFSPALITYPLRGSHLNPNHLRDILTLAERKDAVCLGNGAGRKEETLELFSEIFRKVGKPMVIDADAIYAVKGKVKGAIITPHYGEFAVLSGKEPPKDFEKRAEQVRTEAKRLGCTIALKGHIDIISDGKRLAIDRKGSPFMTKGGLGDTLAGIAVSLLAQRIEPFKAACAAAYINGAAGELAAWEKKQGLLPTDLIEKIPEVIKKA